MADQEMEAKVLSILSEINVDSIFCIEIANHDLIIHQANGDIKRRARLKDFEDVMEKYNIFKCHRSYLVNIDKIDRIEKNSILLTNAKCVPVSRSYKEKIKNILNAMQKSLNKQALLKGEDK